MMGVASQRVFRTLERAFWGLWLLFPVYVVVLVREILADPVAAYPGLADCAAAIPQVATFGLAGQVIFWSGFALHLAVFAALVALAHAVVRSCARGRTFVAPLVRHLRNIGWIVVCYPVLDLLLLNLTGAALEATGDMPGFAPTFALDLPTLGVGLLLLTMAMAMDQAMVLQQDADLTI